MQLKGSTQAIITLFVLACAVALSVYAYLEVSDTVAVAEIVVPLVNGSGACILLIDMFNIL